MQARAEGDSSIDSDVLDETKAVCSGDYSKDTTIVLLGLKKIFLKEAKKGGGCGGCGGCCGGGCCGGGGNAEKGGCCARKQRNTAVDGVCLTMKKDECFALLGHNGAGKVGSTSVISSLVHCFLLAPALLTCLPSRLAPLLFQTTTMSMITGQLKPTEGDVLVCGMSVLYEQLTTAFGYCVRCRGR